MNEPVSELDWIHPETGVAWHVAVMEGLVGVGPPEKLRVNFQSEAGQFHTYADLGPDELGGLSDDDLAGLLDDAITGKEPD
ncbi:MAG TPA: hypothetical protein VLL48_00040 [Longimicrobiales bacterium]|nr:hypothetical protein [Longimicrobiales bacterium]